MKKLYALGLVLLLALVLSINFFAVFNGSAVNGNQGVSIHYINNGVSDTGAVNLVTGILFDYRAFDTLGEATVIFAAVSTISLLVARKRINIAHNNFSPIVHQSISLILPFLYVLGFYLIFYGHLSPGGGFTGGVVLATIFILLTITFGIRHTQEDNVVKMRSMLESGGAIGFVLLGVAGMLAGYNFLANGQANFTIGTPGELLSGGLIPLLNLATGVKVGSGLGLIFYCLVKEE
jgi:multicomponent Na+:H+ antiporter subunit B